MSFPVLVIHGGAGSVNLRGAKRAAVEASLRTIIETVYTELENGMSAVDAAVLAARLLEDDPLYNAGKGSKIQSDGKIRMSASLMDGRKRRFSGCVNVEGLKNPILLAKTLQTRRDRVLSGPGAARWARNSRLKFASNYTQATRLEFRKRKAGKSGTIGAVVLDQRGHLAAATSTGGRGFEFPYRVSDSPTTAGNFATRYCAVSATGTGEEIVEFSVASTLCAWIEAGMTFAQATRKMLAQTRKAGAEFGFIALNSNGQVAGLTSTRHLIWASASRNGFSLLGRNLSRSVNSVKERPKKAAQTVLAAGAAVLDRP